MTIIWKKTSIQLAIAKEKESALQPAWGDINK